MSKKKCRSGEKLHTDHKLKAIKVGSPMAYQCIRCGKIVTSKE